MAAWFDSVTWLVELRIAGVWTDVSDYAQGMTLSRGRNDELDQYTAGRATIRLDNRDRRFDPNHASGPYYGSLVPRMRIRVRATYAGVTYGVWHGVVDDLPQTWQKPSNAWVDLPCTDLTYLLSVADLPSWWEAFVASLDPLAYWPLGTQGGADSSGNSRNGSVTGTQPEVAPGLIENTPSGSTTAGSFEGGYAAAATAAATVTATTVAFMAKIPATPLAELIECVRVWSGSSTNGTLYVHVNTSWRSDYSIVAARTAIYVSLTTSAGSLARNYSADVFADGMPHHVAVTVSGTTVTVYVDGSPVDLFASSGSVATPAFDDFCQVSVLNGGTIDEALWFRRALSASEVRRITDMARSSLVMRTDEWADAALDGIGWPAADRMLGSLPFADATFLLSAGRDTPYDGSLATIPQTGSVLAILRQLERTEQGRSFIDRDGNVVFRTRTWSLSNSRTTTSQATFGDSTGELGYSGVGTNESGERLRNVWIVGDATASDSTSITAYGRSTGQVDGVWSLPTEEDSLARWLVSRYKAPSTRVVSLDVEVRADTATIAPAVLGLELGDLVTVRRRPQGVGSTLEVIATVESITHNVTAQGRWTVSIQTGKRMVPAGTTYAVVGTATVGGTAVIAP